MSQTKDKVINIKFRELHYSLKRLNDTQYYDFWKTSICIADDYRFYLDFYLSLRQKGELLNLAQVYIALKTLCGESNNSIDKYKGSFSFPFLMEVRKAGNKFDYLLDIYDFRGSLYFGIRKLLQVHDSYNRGMSYLPFAEGFSRNEINNFINYFYGYIQGFFEAIQINYQQFFFKKVDSNGILFGYKDGDFFEEHYDEPEDYERAVKLLGGELGGSPRTGHH